MFFTIQPVSDSKFQTTTSASYLPALTGIRAVAAGMVFFFHVAEKATHGLLQGFVLQWHVGVTIFFVLSGFLITHRYVDQLRLTPGWWRMYLQNRFARIYPIFFLLTLGVFSMYVLKLPYASSDWVQFYTWKDRLFVLLANLTLTRAYFSHLVLSELPTAWTLTVEETFYLSAPFLLLLARRRAVALVVWPLVAVALGVGLVSLHLHRYGFMDSLQFMFVFTYFGHVTDFIMGVALAFWLRRHGNVTPAGHLTRVGSVALVGCLGLSQFLIGTLLAQPGAMLLYAVGTLLHRVALPFVIAVLFAGLVREHSLLRRALETTVAQWLGRASYVFYLIQVGPYDNAFTAYFGHNTWVRLVAYTAISLALYKWVEHPLHQWLRARRKAAPQVVVAG